MGLGYVDATLCSVRADNKGQGQHNFPERIILPREYDIAESLPLLRGTGCRFTKTLNDPVGISMGSAGTCDKCG